MACCCAEQLLHRPLASLCPRSAKCRRIQVAAQGLQRLVDRRPAGGWERYAVRSAPGGTRSEERGGPILLGGNQRDPQTLGKGYHQVVRDYRHPI
jgi:hypothetical protein